MEDEKEKNNGQGFIKEQKQKGEQKLKDEAKKQIKKKIMAYVMAHYAGFLLIAIVIGALLGFIIASCLKLLIHHKTIVATDSKNFAVKYKLGVGSGEDDDSSSAIKISYNNNSGVYEISHKYSKEEIDNIKNEISMTGKDVSEFTDFEIGIIGGLMENGLNIDDYTVEQLKCFPLFIKAEACTMYLDLRPNSEKRDVQGNYKSKKLKDLKENEIPGVILVQRTNTRKVKSIDLEYIDLKSFNEMVAEAAQAKSEDDLDVLNYFTIDENNNLLVAKWEYEKIEVEGQFPSGVAGVAPKEEFTIKTVKIPYSRYVKKYTMPFDFLVQLLFVTDEDEFCKELTDIVLDSEILINIQETETKTVEEDEQTYIVYKKEEQTVNYDIDLSVEGEDGSVSTSSQSDSEVSTSETSQTYNVKVKTTSITHQYTFEIKEVDTWLVHYFKKYKLLQQVKVTEGPDTTETLGEYGTPSVTVTVPNGNNGAVEQFESSKESNFSEDIYDSVECSVSEIQTSVYTKIDEKHIINRQIEKYPSDPNPTTRTHIYGRDEETGDLEKFLLIYDKYEYTKAMMDSISAWLFDTMDSNGNTRDLIPFIKYLLYLYDGQDHGVTKLDLSIFEPDKFDFDSVIKTGWMWPIGSASTEEKDGVIYTTGEPAKTTISSEFGSRGGENHNGIDIAGSRYTNIIAAKEGKVIKVVDGYEDGNLNCQDGGGYGNHIFIELDDGKVVKYAHLQKGTIKVKKGDVVKQGQLIGQMGTSGKSSGIHLHFEIRDANNTPIDPMEFVDSNNPKPTTSSTSSSLQKWIWEIEGGSQYINGKEWIVVDPDGPDDTMNLAHGMVIADHNGGDSWYPDIIPGKIYEGDIVTEEQASAIWDRIMKGFSNAIDSSCVKYGVTLTSFQKDALISNIYRTGYGVGQNDALVSAYAKGGNAGLWNHMKDTYDTRYPEGTKRRVAEEYELFVKGDYNYNPGSGTTKYDKFCSNPNI